MLDELIMKHRPPSAAPTIEDVLDEPPSLNSPSLNLVSNPGITQFARSDDEDLEEEDQIDGMDEEDDDLPDEGGDAPSQPGQSGGAYDEYANRSEEHTYELQSLMRNQYAVFCLKQKKQQIRK